MAERNDEIAADGTTMTVADYLINKVRFAVSRKAVAVILADREICGDMDFWECEKDSVRLAYADLLKWLVLGPSKVNNQTDSDNGWSHTEAGYELSSEDISRLKAEANAIYEELEPESVLKKKCSFRIVSHGVKRASVGFGGERLAHIIK